MEIQSAQAQMLDYMKLMISELRCQNPLEPIDNHQMTMQLAQFSQLEKTENMNTNLDQMNKTLSRLNLSFADAVLFAEYDYAKSLLGKDVTFYSDEYKGNISGRAQQVLIDSEGSKLQVRASVNTSSGNTQEQLFEVRPYQIIAIRQD